MNIAIIVGTTRDGRVTPRIANWVHERVKAKHDDVTLLDLADYDIPMLAEAPWLTDRALTEGTKKWLDGLAGADGYLFVTAEYNHGMPAVLKNAIDQTTGQMTKKPSGIISHGVVGGARAAEHLRLVLGSKIGSVVIPDSVAFHGRVEGGINDDGSLSEGFEQNNDALDAQIDSLLWYADALKTART